MWFVAVLMYLAAGCLVAIPYVFLAGWEWPAFVAASLCAPAAIVAFFVVRQIERAEWMIEGLSEIYSGSNRVANFRRVYSWLYLGFLLLPIACNGLAVVIRILGFAELSGIVWNLRFVSMLIVVNALIVGFLANALILPLSKLVYKATMAIGRRLSPPPMVS